VLADQGANVSFIDRLAAYRYYNMDQVVGMALAEVERLKTVRSSLD
jgi:UDP-galactopyranose mutase